MKFIKRTRSEKLPTNKEVWYNGIYVNDWACDVSPETGETESNGGKEYEIEYEGKTYHIITDFAETIIYKENEIAQPIDMEEEE